MFSEVQLMMRITAFVLALVTIFGAVKCNCPHEDENLKKISTLYDSFPKDLKIVIEDDVLIDVTELDVHSIDVIGYGRLVFNQGHDISIKTQGIFVKDYGHLIIGSEECRHEDNVHIQLEGDRTVDRTSLGDEGDKYIAVSDQGTLQIHGEDRLAWTKLSGTVDRFNVNKGNVYFRHLDSDYASTSLESAGFAIHVLDSDLNVVSYDVFKMTESSKRTNKNLVKVTDTLTAAEDGCVVTMSIQKKLIKTEGADFETLYTTIETLAGMDEGELLLRDQVEYDAFSMVFVVGGNNYDQSLDQQVGKFQTETMSSIVYKNKVISAVSLLVPWRAMDSHIDVRVINPDVAFPEVTVTHAIGSWRKGDKVLLTSTDYAFNHGEVRTIKDITGEKSFTLSNELNYRHFGEIESGVDMRGEVALLSRNIKISGVQKRGCPEENGDCDLAPKNTDVYGGHIKDISGKTAIVKRNSIHHTFRRAITVHGTFGTSLEQPGVQVYENVAYRVFGHTFFLEDGAEKATILKGNLGAETMKIANDFVTDRRKPTTFWITNPKTYLVNNVAAGSEGFGIWYTFPLEPVGPSTGLAYGFKEMKHTALWKFDNNVVHSNHLGGYNFDFILKDETGSVGSCMRYETRENPFNETTPGVKVQLNRLTAYKNRDINVWLRGGWFELYQLSSAESKKGLQLARASEQAMYVTKSIFLGLSTKNREDSDYPDAVTPSELGQVLGTVFHDGPTFFRKCWFDGFEQNESYISGAIGFAPKAKTDTSVTSSTSDMRFGFIDGEGGNRVIDGLSDESIQGELTVDMQEASTFRDADGSVTRCPDSEWSGPVQVIKAEANIVTGNCVYRDNWKLAVCGDLYGKLKIEALDYFPGTTKEDFESYSGDLRRRRLNDTDEIFAEHADKMNKHRFTTINGNKGYYYEFQYIKDFPLKFRITGLGIEKGQSAVVGTCLPEGAGKDDIAVLLATPNDIYNNDDKLKFVDSLDEVVSDRFMQKVFLKDRTDIIITERSSVTTRHIVENQNIANLTVIRGSSQLSVHRQNFLLLTEAPMLYVHLTSNKVRDMNWDREDNDHCTGEFCPKVVITMQKQFEYSPCFTVTDEQLNQEVPLDAHNCKLPASQPESDWGARDTLASEDGSWGQWSGWAECCNEAGGDVIQTTRYRLCDDPAPRASGADCTGENLQSQPCPTGCPVDGVHSGWSSYGECFCDGIAVGSTGVKSKTQECINVANGGHYCWADLLKYASCKKECGEISDNSVNGIFTSWSEWTECFCDGLAEGSRGASTRSRACEGTANYGLYCSGNFEEVRPCNADCFPDQ